ncbi:mitochondrial import inner membrane translocase subunit Tim10 B isoform X2 [Scyliorhinus canicula]|uniref:mitochondrial import inner membrane translocase subunit Tim10 B isoform X2 n=1 Tax=Scyliorhinus canicula TaxID=7830 RepID=UPI0018F751F0|nr:mitochondrial import inner membrane translocase subunit Tim10 B isoform X2 [Scyliorhinus canicula]
MAELRNLRDFLLLYNKMTESCFNKCVSNMNYRITTQTEENCVNNCAGKLIHTNHRLMSAYVQLMPTIVQRRISDYEAKAAEMAQISGVDLPPTPEGEIEAPDRVPGELENSVIIDPLASSSPGSPDQS